MSYEQPVEADARLASDFPGGIVAGATVRTPCGPRRIETLRPGDMVVTRCEGLRPVRMILSREVSRTDYLKAPDRAPIRFSERAMGPLMPQKPALMAGDHKVLVPGYRVEGQPDDTPVFVTAAELLRSSDEVRVDKSMTTITYYHLVFDAHVVLTVNGLLVESFLTSPKNLDRLHPETLRKLESALPELRQSKMPAPAARFKSLDKVSLLPASF